MKRICLVIISAFVLFGTSVADEGMWLPSLIYKLNIKDMQQLGCELSAEDIYNINNSSIKDAVVSLDRGSCSAEIISEDGLLLTNHHCGFSEIQSHSTVENDYLKDGFWAQTLDEELPNPGKTVSFLIRVEDVTDRVVKELNEDMDYEERENTIRKISGEIQEEAKGDTHYEARVQSLFNNNKYYLFIYEVFSDVRLVGAPPQSIGKFGGDTDNWMWPRHTGDFSIFRIYSGPDGKPAGYSEENIPLKPKHYLPISIKGIDEGDFAMILGYPGTTNRYKSSVGVKYTMDVTNPVRIEVRSKKLEIIDEYMKTSSKARLQYSSKHASSSNYYKFSIGQNKGLDNLNVIEKKEKIEEEFTNWVNANQARKEKYGSALTLIKEGYSDISVDRAREYMNESLLRGPEIFVFANSVQALERALEREDNKERLTRAIERIKSNLDRFYKDYDAETDRKIVAALMKLYHDNVESKFHPTVFDEVQKKFKGDFEMFSKKMFSKSVLTDKASIEAFLDNPNQKILKKDMVFQAAKSIIEKYSELTDLSNESAPFLAEGRRLFVAGLMEMYDDKNLYPDANSTMRLTYGSVLDYEPRDGVIYDYYTTTKGYLEKEIPGDDEFDVPPRMKELILDEDYGRYADDDGSLHTCFITNNDITGGNSGSPVINGEGELIGIAFDGNWEAMSGDLAFEPDLQRCINVDIRFVLWVIDKYAGASNLINEMTIIQ